jgi:hypothetical protein
LLLRQPIKLGNAIAPDEVESLIELFLAGTRQTELAAKFGISLSGVKWVFDPAVGDIYYSANSSTFAIFYEDLGQSIPDPGLIRLAVGLTERREVLYGGRTA